MPRKKTSVAFDTTLITSDSKPVYHFLQINKEWAELLEFSGSMRRVDCTVNGRVTFPCSLMGDGKGGFVIMINKVNRDKAGLTPGGPAHVKLVRNDSKYGLPMPAELREVLKQDPEAEELFESLTKGRQRSAIYYISRSKDVDTRIRYALMIMQHLRNNEGRIDEKKLYHELRRRDF